LESARIGAHAMHIACSFGAAVTWRNDGIAMLRRFEAVPVLTIAGTLNALSRRQLPRMLDP